MGHFEIQGYDMFRGVPSHSGEDQGLFTKFDAVYSGHFHHRHSRGNIHFLGSLGDYSWAEFGSDHGFHILDTETRNIEFIANPFGMHAKIYYDDAGEYSVIPAGGFEYLRNKIVKIVVVNQTNPEMFDWFMSQLEAAQPFKHSTSYEEVAAGTLNTVNAESISDKDTLTVIRECVSMSNNSVNKTKLDRLMIDLYQASQDTE